jgi:hypothetical protein
MAPALPFAAMLAQGHGRCALEAGRELWLDAELTT